MLLLQDAIAASDPANILPPKQQMIAIVLSIAILVVVIELVRKRKLREEYSVLWVVTAIVLMALAIQTHLLALVQQAIGAMSPSSALFFGALVFLMLVSLQYSVRLSKLTVRNKTLCQKLALLERDIEDIRESLGHDRSDNPATRATSNIERPSRSRTTETEAS